MGEPIKFPDTGAGEFETDHPDDDAVIVANLIANQNKIMRAMIAQLVEANQRLGYIAERLAEINTPSWLKGRAR